jgi:hypothetical protein
LISVKPERKALWEKLWAQKAEHETQAWTFWSTTTLKGMHEFYHL